MKYRLKKRENINLFHGGAFVLDLPLFHDRFEVVYFVVSIVVVGQKVAGLLCHWLITLPKKIFFEQNSKFFLIFIFFTKNFCSFYSFQTRIENGSRWLWYDSRHQTVLFDLILWNELPFFGVSHSTLWSSTYPIIEPTKTNFLLTFSLLRYHL